jgi:hypothetical protein
MTRNRLIAVLVVAFLMSCAIMAANGTGFFVNLNPPCPPWCGS